DLARERGCECHLVSPDQVKEKHSSFAVQRFDFTSREEQYEDLVIHLPGRHQMLNAACALTCVSVLKEQGLSINKEAVYKGLDKARWPGRLEKMGDDPVIILDGAHNPSGAQVLADAVRLYFPNEKVYLILGVLQDKDVDTVTKTLCSVASRVTITIPDSPRAAPPDELAAIARRYHSDVSICPDVKQAIEDALNLIKAENEGKESGKWILIISGSLYLVGAARTILLDMGMHPDAQA
ncbi:MAG TPA: hypothetical protein GX505_03050, partial [Clostridiales bacterium]|nr:hypothetical protein [Clostridiales bacterium]